MHQKDRTEMTGFILCADDFAMTEGISRSILRLAEAGRISATSVMSGFRHWPAFASELKAQEGHIDIGLHLNLTLGAPMTSMPRLAPAGTLPSIATLARQALFGAIDRAEIAVEIAAQLDRLEASLGRAPDYIDGHQHAHAFPVIREVLVDLIARRYPQAPPYLRNPCDSPGAIVKRQSFVRKALALAALASGLPKLAENAGIPVNHGFSGYSDFDPKRDYAKDFERYVVSPGRRHLVMCHPGDVDDELRTLDPVVETRPMEAAFLTSSRFTEICARQGMEPKRFAQC